MDLSSNISPAITLSPAARTAAANGTTVDLAGYTGATAVVTSGTITDGTTYTFELQESDNASDWTAVADADLIGTEPAFAAADDNVVKRVGYRGRARYLRLSLATATGSPSTGGVFAAVILRSGARVGPQA
ncbi:hypothetical protein ACN27G_06025 [Plantactinospora sp. WMMB334]|uniref:hypothetical protein n=1 Tax=Plantactinospora sp. WMMB334 TaxID=3404119 RepID=UPI003B95B760